MWPNRIIQLMKVEVSNQVWNIIRLDSNSRFFFFMPSGIINEKHITKLGPPARTQYYINNKPTSPIKMRPKPKTRHVSPRVRNGRPKRRVAAQEASSSRRAFGRRRDRRPRPHRNHDTPTFSSVEIDAVSKPITSTGHTGTSTHDHRFPPPTTNIEDIENGV